MIAPRPQDLELYGLVRAGVPKREIARELGVTRQRIDQRVRVTATRLGLENPQEVRPLSVDPIVALHALQKHAGCRAHAARELGVSPSTLGRIARAAGWIRSPGRPLTAEQLAERRQRVVETIRRIAVNGLAYPVDVSQAVFGERMSPAYARMRLLQYLHPSSRAERVRWKALADGLWAEAGVKRPGAGTAGHRKTLHARNAR